MDDTSRLAATIDAMFHNSSAETRAETEKELMVQMVANSGHCEHGAVDWSERGAGDCTCGAQRRFDDSAGADTRNRGA